MSHPTIVLVGRPNVGKSTLFNRLCETRRALMSDIPGTTRDWQEGLAHWNGRTFRVVDTGGYAPGDEKILAAVRNQVDGWVRSADMTFWIVDGGEGLSAADQALGQWMRARGKNVVLVVNKVDDPKREGAAAEFHRLGYKEVVPISASHGRNIHGLLEVMERAIGPEKAAVDLEGIPAVALLGRPNVGKSSMLNALLGEERMIVSEIPGTTRDAVDTLIERDGKKFLFIDTAGLRSRKSAGAQGLEGLTRIMSEKALERADVAVLLIDAKEGFTEGDIAVGRLIDKHGKACVLGINKWDIVADRARSSRHYRDSYAEELPFVAHAPIVFVSAKTGHHVSELLEEISKAHDAYHRRFDDEELAAFFWRHIVDKPYSHRGRKLVSHGADQVSTAPPTIVLRGNMPDDDVHFSYHRHLEAAFRARYGMQGTPLILKFTRGKR